MPRNIFCFIGTLIFLNPLSAQKFPLKISLFNEATAIPFSRLLTTPVHPGVQVGTELTYRQSRLIRLYQTFNVGYSFHQHLYQGLFIDSDIGMDLVIVGGLRLKGLLGAGYMRSFATQQQYRLEEGVYRPAPNGGAGRATLSLGSGMGYRLHHNTAGSPEIFVLYQAVAEYPFSPGFIPVMPHTRLHAGARFFLKQSH